MFTPHHTLVVGADAEPERWMLVAHGIYGSGANWRTFARRLTERRPDWGLVLVDLRMHGRSLGAPAPHSVGAAVEDLRVLTRTLSDSHRSVRAVFGHSFGGKVALEYRADADVGLQQTWVIDASPTARPDAMDDPENTVSRVLRMLGRLPASFADRREFVDAVVANGFPDPLGHWLAMNLERRDDRYVSRLDVDAMESLLRDYYTVDAWSAVESGPGEVQVVIGGQSSVVSDADRARFDRVIGVDTTVFADSGHWVHVEALDLLLDIVAERLP